ncbi:hypothetical protein ACHAWF_018853 [Thalassiosira exigua]
MRTTDGPIAHAIPCDDRARNDEGWLCLDSDLITAVEVSYIMDWTLPIAIPLDMLDRREENEHSDHSVNHSACDGDGSAKSNSLEQTDEKGGVNSDKCIAASGLAGDEIECGSEESSSANNGDISTEDLPPAAVSTLLDQIGIEVFKFLHPRDLFSLGLTNHHISKEISKEIIHTCLRQLPQNFTCCIADHQVSFSPGHTFQSREELLDHLMDKCRAAELKILGSENQSLDDSLAMARRTLTSKNGSKFVFINPELPEHLSTEYTSVGIHFESNNKKVASSRSAYIVSKMIEAKEEEEDEEIDEGMRRKVTSAEGAAEKASELVATAGVWIQCILSQRNEIAAGTWFWSCRHRNLDFQGVEGKGVMISSPLHAAGKEMEISWTRMTASRV